MLLEEDYWYVKHRVCGCTWIKQTSQATQAELYSPYVLYFDLYISMHVYEISWCHHITL